MQHTTAKTMRCQRGRLKNKTQAAMPAATGSNAVRAAA